MGITNDGEVSTAVYEKLRNFVVESFPFLKDTKFTHTWSGIMCGTPDGLPLIGQVRDNQYVLGGFNGYGFSHALQGSMIIKDLIASGKSSHAGVRLFDPARFLESSNAV
jgi:glycine/D-amino acid oxidase-like deaminating enzyme